MISSIEFSKFLNKLGFDMATGVPDSTFKGLISYFSDQKIFSHLIASNECEAMGIAAGYYLAKQKPAIVYMQNSGFCKTLNPYTSMLSKDVYSIPALMLVGWRGEPGHKDEPQHLMMGRIMTDLFNVMEIPYTILDETQWQNQLLQVQNYFIQHNAPYILVIRKGIFDDYKIPSSEGNKVAMTREEAISIITTNRSSQSVFISTTGKTSRELFEIREHQKDNHGKDFYTVGSMGCASSIAFGISEAQSQKNVFILDGDGAALMQLGTMATIGHYKNPRLKHIILDNNAYESTGEQPTISNTIDLSSIARACGYEYVQCIDNPEELEKSLKLLENNLQLSLLVVKVQKGSRPDLGRPTTTPKENRDAFINYVKK